MPARIVEGSATLRSLQDPPRDWAWRDLGLGPPGLGCCCPDLTRGRLLVRILIIFLFSQPLCGLSGWFSGRLTLACTSRSSACCASTSFAGHASARRSAADLTMNRPAETMRSPAVVIAFQADEARRRRRSTRNWLARSVAVWSAVSLEAQRRSQDGVSEQSSTEARYSRSHLREAHPRSARHVDAG